MMNTIRFFILTAFTFLSSNLYSQSFKEPKTFSGFGKIQVNYALGINEVFNEQKVNPFQIKLIFGKQNDFVGVGIGVATVNYKSLGSDIKLNLNTTSFSLNGHYNLKRFSENINTPFVRASLGYAPKIFRDYAKGLNYDAAIGFIVSNKKGGRYFVEAQYQVQQFEGFMYQTNNRTIAEAIGAGLGFWF